MNYHAQDSAARRSLRARMKLVNVRYRHRMGLEEFALGFVTATRAVILS